MKKAKKDEKTEKTAENKRSFSFSSALEMFQNMKMVSRMTTDSCRGIVISLFIITIVAATFTFLRSGSNALLINELTRASRDGQFTTPLIWTIVLMVFAYATPGLVWSVRNYLNKMIYVRMSETFEMILIRKRAELDLARHEDPKFQDLANRSNERGMSPLLNLMEGQYDILSTLAGMIMASAILFSVDMRLWIIILLGETPSLITQIKYGQNVWNISDAQSPLRRRYYDLRNKFYRGNGLLDIQLCQNTLHFINRIGKMLSGFNAEHQANEKKRFKATTISQIVSTIAISSAVLLVIVNVVNGQTQIGTWLFITGTMFSLQSSFTGLFGCLSRQYENSLYVTDIKKFLATEPVIKRPANGIKVCQGRIPKIEFRNVSFSYPGTDTLALKNFSLTINPGEILAVIGENGAGKTTLAKLLLRIYDPKEGEVLVDGVDLRLIDLESWYAELGVLSQSIARYNFTVEEVIALGRTSVPMSRERVLRAAHFSGADKFIEKLDGQYGQQLGEEFDGTGLSTGQEQRLAIARVIYRDAKLIILDEPTAATDAKAETEIFERLYGLRGKVTAIFISHNYANVVKADHICVVDGGSIVEVGNHTKLMGAGGAYARLFKLQADRFQT